MPVRRFPLLFVWLLGLWCTCCGGAVAASARLALVIGNAAYENEAPLVNTLNDADDMAAKLRELGFEISELKNAGRRGLSRGINRFLRRVRAVGGVALFYYSGHGPWSEGVLLGQYYFRSPAGSPSRPPPSAGHLQVLVDAEQAEIRVDGVVRGTAKRGEPLNLTGLAVGEVEIEARAGDRRARRREVIRANQWSQV